uniref:EF-hand domain-containing protein n=1 Tax=Plectus sambesii TaxID=2011161 RepID=A0A914X2H7_9BILA
MVLTTAERTVEQNIVRMEQKERLHRRDKVERQRERTVAHHQAISGRDRLSSSDSSARPSEPRSTVEKRDGGQPQIPKEIDRLPLDSGRSSARSSRSSFRSSTNNAAHTADFSVLPPPRRACRPAPDDSSFKTTVKRKGYFFYDENERGEAAIVGTRYKLVLHADDAVVITIKPTTNSDMPTPTSPMDTMLAVIDREKGEVIALTKDRDENGCFHARVDLDRGSYYLLPFCTGCRFRPRMEDKQPKSSAALIEEDLKLSKRFRMVLMNVFDMFDLDDNGLLNREEFNLYNVRTGDETVTDDEWRVVSENFSMSSGELTMKGFVELHQLEAKDAEGDTDDMWLSLAQVGYDSQLQLSEGCPFVLQASSLASELDLTVTGIKALMEDDMEWQALTEYLWSNGQTVTTDTVLTIRQWSSPFYSALLAADTQETRQRYNMDFAHSTNAIINPVVALAEFSPRPQEIQMLLFAMPQHETRPWNLALRATKLQ